MPKTKTMLWSLIGIAACVAILTASSASAAHEVVIRDGTFMPREEYVGQGDTVIWVHDDGGAVHSVTADDGSFDSSPRCSAAAKDDCLKAGQTFRHTFPKLGRFRYYSKPHGGPDGQGVSGVIVVVEKGTGPSSSTSTAR